MNVFVKIILFFKGRLDCDGVKQGFMLLVTQHRRFVVDMP